MMSSYGRELLIVGDGSEQVPQTQPRNILKQGEHNLKKLHNYRKQSLAEGATWR